MLFRLFDAHFIPHVRIYPNARVFLVRHFHYQKILPLRRLSVGYYIVHYVGCHSTKGHEVNFTLRVYFAPTNFTLSAYLASKHFGDSACFGSKNLRDSVNLLKILFKVDFICTIQKKAVLLQRKIGK